MPYLSLTKLLWRYLSFVWLFDDIPARANLIERAAIVRGNRDRGLRYLPLYMRRYFRMLAGLVTIGTALDMLASPVGSGACFTLSSIVLVALIVAAVGFTGMRLGAFDHRCG